MALGARTILKTRTDLAILGESVFEQGERWLQNFDPARARRVGLRNRLIVPSSYTRKYLLYHPSDLVDARRGRRHGAVLVRAARPALRRVVHGRVTRFARWRRQPGGHIRRRVISGFRFCRTLGRPVAGTLVDSWAFYRDLFAVVDNDWFDLLWFKNLSIPDAARRTGVRQMVTGAFWQRLFASDPLIERDLLEINPSQFALGALAGAA